MISLIRRWGQSPAAIGLATVLVCIGISLVKGFADDRIGGNPGDESLSGSPVDREQESKRLLNARCAVCHSIDLIVQQRLTREQWIATLNKMTHWGAQVSSVEQTQLADYLAARYHPSLSGALEQTAQDSPEASITEPAIHSGIPEHSAGRSAHGQRLFEQNCMPCHGLAAVGGMGPKLAKSPILTDEGRFWGTVRLGRGAMPPWGTVLTAQEIADIQAWLKTLE